MIAAGCSAGVSAAFGAPIGGTLFAFEISKPNVFWRFATVWKACISCTIAVTTLAIVQSAMKGQSITDANSSVLKFGVTNITPPTLDCIPGAFIVGAICGVLGAVFVAVNSNLGILRKKLIKENWQKLAEAVFFSVLTTSAFYWVPYFAKECEAINPSMPEENQEITVHYDCPTD